MITTSMRVPFTLRGLGGGLAGSLAVQGATFAVEAAIGRRLGATGLGTYVVASGVAGLVSATLLYGLAAAVGTAVAAADERGDAASGRGLFLSGLVASLVASIVASLAIAVSAEPLAVLLLGDARAAEVILVFAASLPVVAIGSIAGSTAVALREVRVEASYRTAEAAIRLLSIPALVVGASVRDVALLSVAAQAFALPFVLIPISRAWPLGAWKLSVARWEWSHSRAVWQVAATVAWVIPRRVDTIVIAAVLGARAAGVYRACMLIASSVAVLLSALHAVFLTVAARRLGTGGPTALVDYYERVARMTLVLSAPIAAATVLLGPVILSILGVPFVEGADALVVLILANVVLVAGGHSISTLLVANGKAGVLNTVASAGLQLALLPLLTLQIGLVGAAAAVFSGHLVLQVLQMRGISALSGGPLIDARYLRTILVAGGLIAVAALLELTLPLVVALACLSVSLILYAYLVIRAVLPQSERQALRHMFVTTARGGSRGAPD